MPTLAGAADDAGDWPPSAVRAWKDTPHTDYEQELADALLRAEVGDQMEVRDLDGQRDFTAEFYDRHEGPAHVRLRFRAVGGGPPADAYVVRGSYVFILTPELDPLLMGFPENARGGIDVHV